MKKNGYLPRLIALAGVFFLMSCMLPGMIALKQKPKGPVPYMEKDPTTVIKTLSGKNWRYLQSLAQEKYANDDYAKPGTLTFTITINDDLPTYFNYGWCAKDNATLQENIQHIHVKLYFNDVELGKDVVQNLTYTSSENLPCLDFGVLMSEWTDGEYKLKVVATFDYKLNDGISDYDAGDYVLEYNVTVKKQKGGAWRLPVLVHKSVFQQRPYSCECIF